jgi:hypothetical protein
LTGVGFAGMDGAEGRQLAADGVQQLPRDLRRTDAKKWFAITPASVAAAKAEREKHSKIIALPKAAAA